MRKLAVSADNSFALHAPDYVDARVLAANTAETHTVPTDAKYVFFSGNADFYVRFNGTAAVPSGDVTDGTASEMNPTVRYLDKTDTLSLVSAGACTVTMSFYKD